MEKIPSKIAEFFGVGLDEQRVRINKTFKPSRGWRYSEHTGYAPFLPRLRMAQRAGYTAVEIQFKDRFADFQIDEVLAYANRPLLGGTVI